MDIKKMLLVLRAKRIERLQKSAQEYHQRGEVDKAIKLYEKSYALID
jgi:hypothetical protein